MTTTQLLTARLKVEIEAKMEELYHHLHWLVEHKTFLWLVKFTILLNPVALAPQVWVATTAASVEGISLTMWVIFALIQAAIMFNGIRQKDAIIFISMCISVLESLSIIALVLVRS